ncbi:MAG: hypothetical protein SFV21_00190 [Rhodospirillaceae bacterium]|nr:hypothetical protein [Rhodospirillaceae bacterium]
MTPFAWPTTRASALLAMLALLSACATRSPAGDAGAFCRIAEPIMTSPADTAETLRQIDRHNAAWCALCAAEDHPCREGP